VEAHPDHHRPADAHRSHSLDAHDQLAKAAHEAQVRFGIRPDPTTPPKLRVLLGDISVTLSELEARFLTLLAEHGLRRPKTNRIASKRRVDCRWPTHCLTVELDSYTFHGSRHAWEQDRRRQREAYASQMLAELHALVA
jgi:hypothetical protein